MCFSASASFSAGVVLTVIGVASTRKVKHPTQILFASIPLIFAIQQMSEGVLWLTLPHPEYALTQNVMIHVFLFFAQFFWPFWVPIAILFLEKKEKRRKILYVLAGLGMLISFYLLFGLVFYHVQANIVGYHVTYKIDFPNKIRNYGGILYVAATVGPSFFSRIKRMWMFGVTILISYLVTAIFYEHYVVSVWCFFASIISISIYLIMCKIVKEEKYDEDL